MILRPVFQCAVQSCSAGALAGGLFVLVYLVSAAAAALHALLTKPDPRSVISWIALCWLFPLGGSILYWLFGINRVATSGRVARGAQGRRRTDPQIPMPSTRPSPGCAASATH